MKLKKNPKFKKTDRPFLDFLLFHILSDFPLISLRLFAQSYPHQRYMVLICTASVPISKNVRTNKITKIINPYGIAKKWKRRISKNKNIGQLKQIDPSLLSSRIMPKNLLLYHIQNILILCVMGVTTYIMEGHTNRYFLYWHSYFIIKNCIWVLSITLLAPKSSIHFFNAWQLSDFPNTKLKLMSFSFLFSS
jgi:hypothetical protein